MKVIKFIMLFMLCFSISLLVFIPAQAQKRKEGKIVYLKQFSDKYFDQVSERMGKRINKQQATDRILKQQESSSFYQKQMMKMETQKIVDALSTDKEQLIYFKKDRIFYLSSFHVSPINNDTLHTIFLKEDDSIFKIVLGNLNGMEGDRRKIALKKDVTDGKEMNNIMKIEYLKDSEPKEILGYKCKKAIVTKEIRDTAQKTIVYYTEELPNVNLNFPNLKGLPLLIENEEEGYTIIAKEISFDPVPDERFEIPKGYSLMIRD